MIALDLFAGTEIMPEAIATRELNGMATDGASRARSSASRSTASTIYRDVWEGLDQDDFQFRDYDLLIASPPCQTFSMAGGGAGRKALDDVLGLIDAKAYRSVEDLRAFGESHDPRTALVLTPLAHVYRDLPRYVVFEQVPPVLPVWERCAEEMRAWGYSVWTGNLQAEMYGVPQTRKRAILIAKRDPDLDGEAAPPTPTHSRYYSRDPKRLDEGVLPWISMAEALGWGMTERPFVTAGNASNRGERVADEPSATITSKADRNLWEERPAYTVTGGGTGSTGGAECFGRRAREAMGNPERVTVAEAAALQSYPPGFRWDGEVTKERFARVWDRHRDPSDPDDEGEYHFESRGIQTKPITKTKQFPQVGNAVPPLLAEAILRAVIS